MERLTARLLERIGTLKPCGVCGGTDLFWIVDGFASIDVQQSTHYWLANPAVLACAATMCKNCGHMRLFNLKQLGLGHLAEREAVVEGHIDTAERQLSGA